VTDRLTEHIETATVSTAGFAVVISGNCEAPAAQADAHLNAAFDLDNVDRIKPVFAST
jgi:hypothetical protein